MLQQYNVTHTVHIRILYSILLKHLKKRLFTKFEEPAFSVGVEKGVSQIIPVIFRDFEGLIVNTLIEFLRAKTLNTLLEYGITWKLAQILKLRLTN